MIRILKKLFFLLSSKEQKYAVLLFVMVLFMAFLDMIGIASIMPFMAVLTNPELIETNEFLNLVFKFVNVYGVDTAQQFMFILGIVVLVLLVLSLTFKALTMYLQLRFIMMCEYTISKRLLTGYLSQPYSWFLNHNSSELSKNILSEVTNVISKGLSPMISLITQIIIVITILSLLIFVNPKLALISGFFIGGIYGLIYKFARNFLKIIGQERLKANQSKFKTVNEAFGATKVIKVSGLENVYIKRFDSASYIHARHQASAQTIALLPRFALEGIAFGGMMLVTLILMGSSGTFTSVAPIIALYAFAGYRLIPSIQSIYTSLTQLRFIGPSLDDLHKDLMSRKKINLINKEYSLSFNSTLILNNINFKYDNSSRLALKNINLKIYSKTTVGIVGSTGSGKTTTLDLILGLLEPNKGTMKVDGKIINRLNRGTWQQMIGYVPQHIFLADDTVAANIAFGIEKDKINLEALERASKIANLHKFVMEELPLNYQTIVGERGIRLSGGQIQRIGIARALYHNPQLLIFDEATSALDNLTEKEVMDAINKLGNKITIIIVAHRLSTVKKCEKIFLFDKGELKGEGTYDQMIENNKKFREMTQLF